MVLDRPDGDCELPCDVPVRLPGCRQQGYPAFRRGNGQVPVSVLTSPALPEHWARLDEFEGADYRRILVPVTLASGAIVVANLYEYIAQITVGERCAARGLHEGDQ